MNDTFKAHGTQSAGDVDDACRQADFDVGTNDDTGCSPFSCAQEACGIAIAHTARTFGKLSAEGVCRTHHVIRVIAESELLFLDSLPRAEELCGTLVKVTDHHSWTSVLLGSAIVG